ncbi:MAG: copper resistance protein NlpE N-terminal domain-containing protein [Pseudomonadales bacterium]|nr:copper resistance protein NlpE N-terminal domain-containing protein [Pseudomonadales bacterium]
MTRPRISLLLISLMILAVSGCRFRAPDNDAAGNDIAENAIAENTIADAEHSARTALDWAGSYRGVLPCADCEGIEVVVVLRDDGSYDEFSRYLGDENNVVFSEMGDFTWNEVGDTVIFAGEEPTRYAVGENQLFRLALDGSRISGDFSQNYVLSKLATTVLEQQWRLIELNGKPVENPSAAPYFVLRREGNLVAGFGGCNNFSGTFTLDEAVLRLRFNNLISTLRGCITGMELETQLHEALRNADNYSLNGSLLSLNRARMAPLARFEAVYLY